jgi:hypothetical protein
MNVNDIRRFFPEVVIVPPEQEDCSWKFGISRTGVVGFPRYDLGSREFTSQPLPQNKTVSLGTRPTKAGNQDEPKEHLQVQCQQVSAILIGEQ